VVEYLLTFDYCFSQIQFVHAIDQDNAAGDDEDEDDDDDDEEEEEEVSESGNIVFTYFFYLRFLSGFFIKSLPAVSVRVYHLFVTLVLHTKDYEKCGRSSFDLILSQYVRRKSSKTTTTTTTGEDWEVTPLTLRSSPMPTP
jgi:hypothetical protein